MGEFFKPRRRKFGVAALVIACMFTAGWIRSYSVVDMIDLPVWRLCEIGIASSHGSFGCAWATYEEEAPRYWRSSYSRLPVAISFGRFWYFDFIGSTDEPVQQQTNTSDSNESAPSFADPIAAQNFAAAGGVLQEDIEPPVSERIIPYWSVVIPLTLFSAWLLLIKPRQSKVASTFAPAPERAA